MTWRKRAEPETVTQSESHSQDKYASEFEHTVTLLVRDTYYVFSVYAKTQDGWGEPTVVEVYTTANRGECAGLRSLPVLTYIMR